MVALIVVLARPGGGGDTNDVAISPVGGGDLLLQDTEQSGPDPWTASTASGEVDPIPAPEPTVTRTAIREIQGGAENLYGGTGKVASCDVERQIGYLQADQNKARAFAGVLKIGTPEVPGYLRGLTPVQLRHDTWVTNHGYRDGKVFSFQAVLQSGTAVLVDKTGMPKVRCACGNPLTERAEPTTPLRPSGDPWPGYREADVVVVKPAPQPVKVFVIVDVKNNTTVKVQPGSTQSPGRTHTTTPPHTTTAPPDTTTTSPGPTDSSPTACATVEPGEPAPKDVKPCPTPTGSTMSPPDTETSTPPVDRQEGTTDTGSPGSVTPEGSPESTPETSPNGGSPASSPPSEPPPDDGPAEQPDPEQQPAS
ncbi:DUF6777 domain-containing protein [Streptomyces sp. NPDC047886]|uniref:DUF6777 domain-containing protein n=1 Tax=Streptomyces sp. NPDC047886 TaxID=3365490 RepID=UPI00371FE410